MSVWKSAWENSVPNKWIFMKLDIWVFFENLSRKFKLHWNLTRITGTLLEDQYIFLIISLSIFLIMRTVSEEICRENQNTHFVFKNFFLWKSCLYEKMWETVVKPGRATDDNMARAHCTLGTQDYKHTLAICNTHCFFHCKSDCMCAPQCYVMRTFPVSLITANDHTS